MLRLTKSCIPLSLKLNMIRVPNNITTVSTLLIQKRNLSEVNQKYIDLMEQNKHDKELAFWGGFIVSSIIMPYGGCIGILSSLYTESIMLKNIKEMERLTRLHKMNEIHLDKINVFVKQPSHKYYFVSHNVGYGMFYGSLFFTFISVAMLSNTIFIII
jgi:hypothetical protein